MCHIHLKSPINLFPCCSSQKKGYTISRSKLQILTIQTRDVNYKTYFAQKKGFPYWWLHFRSHSLPMQYSRLMSHYDIYNYSDRSTDRRLDEFSRKSKACTIIIFFLSSQIEIYRRLIFLNLWRQGLSKRRKKIV